MIKRSGMKLSIILFFGLWGASSAVLAQDCSEALLGAQLAGLNLNSYFIGRLLHRDKAQVRSIHEALPEQAKLKMIHFVRDASWPFAARKMALDTLYDLSRDDLRPSFRADVVDLARDLVADFIQKQKARLTFPDERESAHFTRRSKAQKTEVSYSPPESVQDFEPNSEAKILMVRSMRWLQIYGPDDYLVAIEKLGYLYDLSLEEESSLPPTARTIMTAEIEGLISSLAQTETAPERALDVLEQLGRSGSTVGLALHFMESCQVLEPPYEFTSRAESILRRIAIKLPTHLEEQFNRTQNYRQRLDAAWRAATANALSPRQGQVLATEFHEINHDFKTKSLDAPALYQLDFRFEELRQRLDLRNVPIDASLATALATLLVKLQTQAKEQKYSQHKEGLPEASICTFRTLQALLVALDHPELAPALLSIPRAIASLREISEDDRTNASVYGRWTIVFARQVLKYKK